MREYWTKLNGEPLDIDIKVEDWNAIEELLSSLYNSLNKTNTKTKTVNKIKPKNKDVTVLKDIRPKEAVRYNKRNETKFKPLYIPQLKRVQFSPPATIAWFEDGSKSVAVAGHGDVYDKETGLAICMLKRVLGNKEYRRIMDEHCYVNKETLN